jgi:hypothetical protein
MQRGLALQREVLLQLLHISYDLALVLVIAARSGVARSESVLRRRGLPHWLRVHWLHLRVGLLYVHVLHLLLRHRTHHVRVHEAVGAGVRAFEGLDGDGALLVRESVAHHELERALRIECGLRGLRVEPLGFFEIHGLTRSVRGQCLTRVKCEYLRKVDR